MPRTFAVLAGVVLSLGCASLTAQEWTRFRGPNGGGQSEAQGIPSQWTAADYNWKISLPGVGHSSPVIWGEKLFLLSASPDDATRHVLCVSTRDGKTLWRKDFKSTPHHLHLRNSYATSSPTVDAERVYFAWSTPKQTILIAFDHEGNEVWQRDLGPFVSQHGFGTSPMIYQDMVILADLQLQDEKEFAKAIDAAAPGESFVYAFAARTGEIRWKTPQYSTVASYSVPCVYKNSSGKDELIGCASGRDIFSLDPQTGKKNWSIDVFTMRTVSSPMAVGELVFGTTGSGGGGNYLVAVKPGVAAKVAYEIKEQAPYVPAPVARGELLFLWSDKGIVSCVDAATGRKHWQQRVGSNFSGSPVRVGDYVYCIDEAGTVFVVAAKLKYEFIGKMPLGDPSRSTPAISGGQMFLRTESQLFAIGGGTN